MRFCSLCGEALKGEEVGFHHIDYLHAPIPTWEGCLRASRGDHKRIIRVHHKMVLESNFERYT